MQEVRLCYPGRAGGRGHGRGVKAASYKKPEMSMTERCNETLDVELHRPPLQSELLLHQVCVRHGSTKNHVKAKLSLQCFASD